MSTHSVEGSVEHRARSDTRIEWDQKHRAGAEYTDGQIWSVGMMRGGRERNIAMPAPSRVSPT
jgi:hypothetical protein